MCHRELTANDVSVADSVLSCRQVISAVCYERWMKEKNTYDDTNVTLGGGLHNACRLLNVQSGEMNHSLSVLGGA